MIDSKCNIVVFRRKAMFWQIHQPHTYERKLSALLMVADQRVAIHYLNKHLPFIDNESIKLIFFRYFSLYPLF